LLWGEPGRGPRRFCFWVLGFCFLGFLFFVFWVLGFCGFAVFGFWGEGGVVEGVFGIREGWSEGSGVRGRSSFTSVAGQLGVTFRLAVGIRFFPWNVQLGSWENSRPMPGTQLLCAEIC